LQFRILGPLQLLNQGRLVPLGGAKQRSTLAMLLLGRNHVVSRDRLIDGLWGTSPPPSAGPSLETYISRLRRVLQGNGEDARLVTQPPGYRLRVEPGELDLERFETLLEQARTARAAGDFKGARNALRDALSLFRGAPLEDLVHAPFAQAEIGRLEEARLGALEQRLEADLAVGRHAEVVGELESLVARHPFREVLWGQLMLALYRSGRQGEAVLAFDRARRTLAEELGVDPSTPLRQLHLQVLQQDPALEILTESTAAAAVAASTRAPSALATGRSAAPSSAPAAAPRPIVAEPPTRPSRDEDRALRRGVLPGRRALIVGAALAVAVTLAAIFIPRLGEEGGSGSTMAAEPGTALIDLRKGKVITSIPLSRLAGSAYPVFADGHFWVHNFNPNSYVQIDPKTGAIVRQVNPPARPVEGSAEPETLTPFAVQGNMLWVGSGHDLVKMDISLGKVVERFRLDDSVGGGSGLAEGVAVGGGSVWVSRDVGRGQIVRLDPATGAVQHRFDDMNPYLQLAYGDGSLWAADESFARAADERGLASIDAETNTVTRTTGIRGNIWVAAGGGFGWTSDPRKGAVYKVDETGDLVETYTTGLGAGFMAYTDGVLWVANHDEGTVTGIDVVTGEQTTYRFRHPVETIAAGDGILLVYVARAPTTEDFIASIPGTVAKFFADAGQLGAGEEPALNTSSASFQIGYATCAMLLNYPDTPGPQGWQLQPEVAATMPAVSPDARTYTFTIRPGYKFSPPSNEPVTPETFRYSIERALSPRLADNPLKVAPPGPQYIQDIQGEQAFRSGRAKHISGLRASGQKLSITLTKPSHDFLMRLTLPFFCPVPIGTPFVAGAPHQGQDVHVGGYIPSAGPYYVADFNNDEYVILKRNPNYEGPRRQAFDAIAILEGVGASIALDWTEQRGWDGITNLSDPLLGVGGVVDRRWGPGSAAAARADQRYFRTPEGATRFVAFNASRGIFADARVRRAAGLALDRSALAAAWGAVATDQLLSPALPHYTNRELYPLSASTAKAWKLMGGGGGAAVMAISAGCNQCMEAANVVQGNLGAVGIDVTIRKLDDVGAALESGVEFDLLDMHTALPYPDSASFLAQMIEGLPSGWVPADVGARVKNVARLSGDRRQAAAASLADRLATVEVPVAAYATPQTSQFIGPRIGCRVFSPFAYGLDLAAMCTAGRSG
jgi:DNA-binding SARP family transcriptional activator/ABC-type transport system substrate-binding protein/outer membrane protein assembly factor BamB